MQSIQNALLTAIQKGKHMTAPDAIRSARCGQIANVTRLREQGFVAVSSTAIHADLRGRNRQMNIYKITQKGTELLARMNEKDPQRFVLKVSTAAPRKRTIETYTPRQRDPREALGVQFAPMHQPVWVQPRWESVR